MGSCCRRGCAFHQADHDWRGIHLWRLGNSQKTIARKNPRMKAKESKSEAKVHSITFVAAPCCAVRYYPVFVVSGRGGLGHTPRFSMPAAFDFAYYLNNQGSTAPHDPPAGKGCDFFPLPGAEDSPQDPAMLSMLYSSRKIFPSRRTVRIMCSGSLRKHLDLLRHRQIDFQPFRHHGRCHHEYYEQHKHHVHKGRNVDFGNKLPVLSRIHLPYQSSVAPVRWTGRWALISRCTRFRKNPRSLQARYLSGIISR